MSDATPAPTTTAPRPSLPRRTPRVLAATGLVAALLALAACTGAADEQGDGGGGSAASGADLAYDAGGDAAAAADAAPTADPARVVGADLPGERAVVTTGGVQVLVDDVRAAADAAAVLATGSGGLVAESSSSGGAGEPGGEPATATLTLRVPSDRFAEVLAGVEDLGEATSRTTSSTDVTAEVADVASRVDSAEAVLAGFRARLPEATDVEDVIALERELAARQADLEALQARQRVLADQTSLATLDVALAEEAAALPVEPVAAGGFTGGLGAGWDALVAVVRVAAVVVGAVLPFAAVAALVVVPLVVLRRRRGARPSEA